jgi:hypothetical protein
MSIFSEIKGPKESWRGSAREFFEDFEVVHRTAPEARSPSFIAAVGRGVERHLGSLAVFAAATGAVAALPTAPAIAGAALLVAGAWSFAKGASADHDGFVEPALHKSREALSNLAGRSKFDKNIDVVGDLIARLPAAAAVAAAAGVAMPGIGVAAVFLGGAAVQAYKSWRTQESVATDLAKLNDVMAPVFEALRKDPIDNLTLREVCWNAREKWPTAYDVISGRLDSEMRSAGMLDLARIKSSIDAELIEGGLYHKAAARANEENADAKNGNTPSVEEWISNAAKTAADRPGMT